MITKKHIYKPFSGCIHISACTELPEVTQMFLNWNQIRSSLEQWKSILTPEATYSLFVTTTGY